MIGDARRFDLVKGKNLEAIKKRFGLVRRDDLLPYQEFCLKNGSYHDKDIAFLGDSKWMILFEDGKVVDLILCKGM